MSNKKSKMSNKVAKIQPETAATVDLNRSVNRFCANAQIVVYRLSSKVVSMEENISDKSREVAYYTLAVGHHTGVLDCFTAVVRFSYTSFEQLLDLLPVDGSTHYKFDGLRKFGEITIGNEHARQLLDDLREASMLAQKDGLTEISGIIQELEDQLQLVLEDPVIYLVAKRLL